MPSGDRFEPQKHQPIKDQVLDTDWMDEWIAEFAYQTLPSAQALNTVICSFHPAFMNISISVWVSVYVL